MKSLLTSIMVLLALSAGCQEKSPSGLPTVKMKLGNESFVLEVARTGPQQEKGLMERDALPNDHGMIFIFPTEQVLSFYMKNTRFPLDIVFLDGQGKIVSIHQMKAYDLTTTFSDVPAKYAIELNKGAASAAGVKVGDVVPLPPDVSKGE